jgi:Carboxypeptidase regulatory-like domain
MHAKLGGGMRISRMAKCFGFLLLALALFPAGRLLADIMATISGTVSDPTGAVIAGATVTATNVDTGVALSQTTNAQGFYSFPELPVGKYTIDVQKAGCKAYRRTGLVLDVNQTLFVDVPSRLLS